ncbi:PREDICTED: uncharacterized protein LOC106928634 isoform X1 [Poecilia mexicana]|uniref:uncharacterized protein LOC106928634 isoform X1 n=2 Tax=Poecilia mexicana TaxID=48701 RepID=UPI00072E960E|nr:PREDICTED: uncharacterized protein LOC106928634 isoform X1 [Poecilia mexicana]
MPHCVALGCHYNTKKNRNTQVSLHRFPNEKKVRAQWERAVGRIHLPKNPYLCSQHFSTEDYESFVRAQLMKELTGGRYPRKLKLNAVPTIFPHKAPQHHPVAVGKPGAKRQRLTKLGALNDSETTATGTTRQLTNRTTVQEWHSLQTDHNYCFIPGPPAKKRSSSSELDKSISATEDQSKYVKNLRKKIWEQFIQQEFCLQRFAGSDDDIQFYTRFPSYKHLMAFWFLIEPWIHKMVRMSRAKLAAKGNEEMTSAPSLKRRHLQPVDEFFLFLVFLSLGMKERDLAIRFNTHQSIVSLIIATWTNFLFTILGSQCIWLTQQQVQAYLPEEFKDFPDTQVILDCTELKCQIPSSPLPQMDMNPSHRSLCTMRALVGIAPHGAVTFVSDLYRGSFSNRELFKCSGIAENLTEDMAVMVNKGFLIRDCCECKVYPLTFLSKHPGDQATARLKMHVEQVIGRVKQNKLFHGIVSLSQAYNINQLFVVACLLSNYQNTALVKKGVH